MIVAAVVGIIVLCIACSGVGFVAFAAVSTPSEKKLCEHMIDLSKKEGKKLGLSDDEIFRQDGYSLNETEYLEECISDLKNENLSKKVKKCFIDTKEFYDLSNCNDEDID